MDTGTLFLIQYVITIPIAIFAFFFMPQSGTLSNTWENARRNGALLGLLPCGPLSILWSVGMVGAYYLRIKAIERKEGSLAAGWSSDSTPTGNPFGGGTGRTPSANSGNPFATEDEQTSGEDGRPNPFA
mgnify:CR=1 FL=1